MKKNTNIIQHWVEVTEDHSLFQTTFIDIDVDIQVFLYVVRDWTAYSVNHYLRGQQLDDTVLMLI